MSSPSKGWQHDLPGTIYRAEVVGLGWWTAMRGCRVRGWAIRSGLIPVNISPLYRQRISSFGSEMMWAEALASSLRASLGQAQHSLYNIFRKPWCVQLQLRQLHESSLLCPLSSPQLHKNMKCAFQIFLPKMCKSYFILELSSFSYYHILGNHGKPFINFNLSFALKILFIL